MYFNCKLTGKYQKAHADSTISENVNINDLSDNQRKRKFQKKKNKKRKETNTFDHCLKEYKNFRILLL